MIRRLRFVAPLLGTTAFALIACPASSATDAGSDVGASSQADADRDYLPSDIVVTGARNGYTMQDGSTATKTPTPLIDVPQTVAVITDDQLADQSITQLGEALRYVPGISLETGEGHRDEVFIRGQESTADFYLDGLRDDAQYYRSLYNVERIEVLKGANALIFGRGGGGGVINRVSRTANFAGRSVNANAQVDSFGAFALTADANAPLTDGIAARISATYEEFDSHRDFYEGRFVGISPTVTAQIGPDTRITAHYTYDDDSRVGRSRRSGAGWRAGARVRPSILRRAGVQRCPVQSAYRSQPDRPSLLRRIVRQCQRAIRQLRQGLRQHPAARNRRQHGIAQRV